VYGSLLSQARISFTDPITRLPGWPTSAIPLWWPRIAVRTVLQLSLEAESIFIRFVFESCALEVLARRGWSLYVGLPVLGTSLLLLRNITDAMATFLAGSLSRLLTLSGVLSKDVAATGGRSGFVVIPLFQESSASGRSES
jgi:hypothetical protein